MLTCLRLTENVHSEAGSTLHKPVLDRNSNNGSGSHVSIKEQCQVHGCSNQWFAKYMCVVF